MSTDYTLNKVKLSNNKRLEVNIDDFIKEYEGYLTIEKEEENNYGKSYGVKNSEGLYLWFFTDFDGVIDSVCRYGRNYFEDISSILKSYSISQLDSETIKYYQSEYSINITNYILISEYDMGLIDDLFEENQNKKLIDNICGEGYYDERKDLWESILSE